MKGLEVLEEQAVREAYQKSVTLWYMVADNDMKSCGHPGVSGPSADPYNFWDGKIATLEAAIRTMQICLKHLKSRK